MPTEATLNLPDSAQYHFEFLIAEASDGSKAWFSGHASASAPGGWSYTLGGGDLAGKQITSVYTLEHTGAIIGATSTLAERSTLVRNEFSGAQISSDKISVADFNDVSAATGVVGAANMVDFIDLKEVNLSNIPDYSGDVWANEGPFVTYNGATSLDGSRQYFISAHDGTVPGGWAAHDTISSHQIDLGSWTFDRQVLAKIDLTGAFMLSSNDAVNLLSDGDFTQPLGEVWYDWTNAGALFSDAPGAIPGDIASLPVGTDLFQRISALGNGTYKLTFLARNPSPNDAHLVFALQQAGGISVNKLVELGLAKEVILPANSDFVPVELTFTVSSPDFSVNEFFFSNSYVFPESSIPNSVNPPGTVIEVADALLIAYDPATDANTAPVITSIGGGPTKIGSEFLVNTSTTGSQGYPKIAALNNGNFIVTWQDGDPPNGVAGSGTLGDSGGSSIKGQLFGPSGDKLGSEFLVNSQAGNNQLSPHVAALSNGSFVVSWWDGSGTLGDPSGSIKAQVFRGDGVKIGGEFLVNTQTASDQTFPTITSLSNGSFVVTWQDGPRWGGVGSGTLGDTGGSSIKMQIFSADGIKVGSEKLVNTETAADQLFPRIAGLSNGGFVVTWYDFSGTLGDSDGPSVKAQVFGADGAKVGSEVLVNTETASGQWIPSVTGLANGGFVVTWSDDSGTLGDSSGRSVKAQIFGADGTKVGGEFLVNSETAGDQDNPAIAGLPNGGFIVTWTDFSGTLGDADGGSVKAQAFDANGARVGSEFLVNTQTSSYQAIPAVAALANGNIAISWVDQSGTLGDASGHSIKAQIFDAGSSLSVRENVTAVTTVTASDPDAGTTLSYSISGGADAAKFQINATTGALSFKSAPNFEAPTDAGGNNIYDVTVQVSDGSLTDTQALAVSVTNVNELPSGAVRMLQSPALPATSITSSTTQFYWDPAQGGNGHIYEYVTLTGSALGWNDIKAAAAGRTLAGVSGYMATVTSAAEDTAIYSHFGSQFAKPIPLGASDAGSEGNWRWMTGPEAGTQFWSGRDAASGGMVVSNGYNHWVGVEPNNNYPYAGDPNDYLVYFQNGYAPGFDGAWADDYNWNTYNSYVVEYSAAPIEVSSKVPSGTMLYADSSQISDPESVGAISWQWQRSSDKGATWTDIPAATQPSYALGESDTGMMVRTSATYVDGAGNSEKLFSQPSSVTLPGVAPTITSNGEGDTAALSIAENTTVVTTVAASDPDASTTLSYSITGGADAAKFQINATTGALSFKTAPNFEAPGDAGANNVYDVVVQASDGSLTDTQALAVTVTNVNEQPSGGVTIAGTGTVGSTLAASHNVVDPDGPGTGGYQWTRNGTNITGATGANYTLTNADAGQTIAVKLTYTDGGGFRQSVASGSLSVASLAPGVSIAGADFTTGEDGNVAVFSVSLDKAPVDPVTLVFSVSDGSEGSLAVTSLTFTSANWNVAQTLTVSGVDDFLNDGTQAYALRTVIDTRDLSYLRLTIADVTLSNLDDGQDKPLFLYGDNEINYLTGGNGNDRIYAAGNMDELRGGRGDDRLYGEQDNDRLYGGEGLDQLYGGYDDDELYGDAGNDKLYGEAGDDRLEGGIGNDILDGGTGADTMVGGAGNDTYYVDDTGDVIDDQGASTDVDTVLVLATIQYTLAANVENASLGKDSGDAGLTGNTLANDLTGNSGGNTLAGGGGNDALDGGAGNDALNGGTGNDVLVGGLGNDNISGGIGTDTADFSDAQGNVSVDLGANRATGDGTDTLSSIENVAVGGGDDVVTGNAGANTLNGGSGNDRLTGGDGGDVLVGGTGGDTLYAGNGDDTVNAGSGDDVIVGGDGAGNDRYNGGTGVDTIRYTSAKAGIVVDLSAAKDQATSIAAGDAAGIGVDQLSGIENVIAGNYADRITGSSAANVLRGMQGRDIMNGGAGSDRLIGGTGRDSLTGGTGADSFVFDDPDFGGATATTADRIVDFNRGQGDRIDLKLVDANTANGATDNAFTFIGTKAFSKVAGELRFAQSSGNTYVSGDTDGNGTADFMIRLDGLHTLVQADFVL